MLAYLFPGQGSQAQGMGKDLFTLFPEYIQQADELLGYSIKQICLENPQQQLHYTLYTQPAIYIINCLTYLKFTQEQNQQPDFVAGHSLGEYNALFAANVFDFITGLKLVKKRAELMSQATDGGMAVIVGLNADHVQEILQHNNLTSITISNYNSYQQIVISGLKIDIQQALNLFLKFNYVTATMLNVSGAFHSPYMIPAQQEFAYYLTSFNFNKPTLPVIANINAKPYHPATCIHNLAAQISQPVHWTRTIEYLLNQGNMNFAEIGHVNILANLVRRIANKQ